MKSAFIEFFEEYGTSRSPSWGAWIEITLPKSVKHVVSSRSPSWGAWIEICGFEDEISYRVVAPPRGERGLKFGCGHWYDTTNRRSPSWGAWIEITLPKSVKHVVSSRSPSWGAWIEIPTILARKSETARSLPLVGSVD